MKKLLSLFLAVALLITLVPPFSAQQTADAAASYFLFTNEQDTAANARIVSTPNVTLTGKINGVVGNSISYKVQQVTVSGSTEVVENTTEEITTGISTSTGDNNITVSNLTLFPGLNKITFKGIAGTSTVSESIYIEYRNSPMLYDLKVTFENKDYLMPEDEPTMLYSTQPVVKDTGEIVISGKAPNAQKITVIINTRSYEFNVSSTSDSRFSTSLLSINKGINTVVLKVHNNGQVIETTRQIAFYNGEVTYYDLMLTGPDGAGTTTTALEPNLNFSTTAASPIQVNGKAIIPLPIKDFNNVDGDATTDTIPLNWITPSTLAALLKLEVDNGIDPIATVGPNTTTNPIVIQPAAIDASTQFITVSFQYDLTTLVHDKTSRIRFTSPNKTVMQQSSWHTFVLRDKSKPYIYDINYLSGYDPDIASDTDNTVNDIPRLQSLQGTDIDSASGVNVYSMPMAVEVLIGNSVDIADFDILKVNGVDETSTTGTVFRQLENSQIVYRTINNVQVPFLRVFIEISQLPSAGTNNVKFKLNSGVTDDYSIIAKLLYGPYVKFETIVDGKDIPYDTVRETKLQLFDKLGKLNGQLFNIASLDEIVYSGVGQSVFLYINNVEIPLVANSTNKTKFLPNYPASTTAEDEVYNILNKAGENTMKFVFRTTKNNYESTIKFSIIPSNLPVIPAPNTDGVYPYSSTLTTPLPNDPNFVKQGSVYTTKEALLNVYGTFDFVDLGGEIDFAAGHATLAGSYSNYRVEISSPNWATPVVWDLSKEFTPTRNGAPLAAYATAPFNGGPGKNVSTPDAKIDFFYDVDNQYFYFKIIGQKMPDDGSSQVYVANVFNAGISGPRATYRMEIDSVSIPYTILTPVTEKRTTNQNYTEIIIASPGADSIVIGKDAAKKVKYIDYSQSTPTYIDAFSYTYKGLKPNKVNDIDFTITRGDDKIKASFTMNYQPANIPGAQYMETMKNSHKVFDGKLALTFEKSTKLVRPTYNASSNHAGQVYSDNNLLFAIANPNDGIVDRHEFESQPPDYSANSVAEGNLHVGVRFQDQARQFIKASPMFWIDGGKADNPDPITSPAFDPVTTGQDPFPFPNVVGKSTESFAKRWNQYGLELQPTKAGKLTLTYDASVAQAAGTTITVFRFDPYNSTWDNIGGVVDEKKHTITVPFTKFGYYVAVKLTRGYNDINDHPYAREAMEAIYAKGIMNAVDPIGIFGADRYVSRGEFTRMIVRALDLPLNYSGDMHFTYYPETITNSNNANAIYDYRYIETAARAGIVRGTRPGFFDEDVDLTRQDASVILAKALNLKLETDSAKAKKALDKIFKDSGSFDYYSIPSVIAIQKKGFIQGSLIDPNNPKGGTVFEPKAKLLRSDAAIIMAKVMVDLKKLPKIYAK
ncbi:S-layer homology domain-containing protein [Paenibacillus sp. NEAU-GSW1]|uniref:S-layer homology domain-containing protein n=1 Tax=Paenibacillus sp. NEAU-GSW1 TaxID=2682486 RepID=UPI0012E29612|nr:S-layer homology domain-containing protein [Paenibacillus sp. NEAU-GSW1]MUT65037.1 hypothetical protein [Paenibacillus sp. NEAU-GSW1]